MSLDLARIRHHFPALTGEAVFLDNPGGTQVAKYALDRLLEYLIETNANHHGAFKTSRASDAVIHKTREAMADFLGASRPEEIVFGPNMTSLTFHLSRALARRLSPGEAVAVTRLDHDANVAPWLLMAEERGLEVLWVDFHPEDGTLDLESYARAMERKPKLVAFAYASNALGTVLPVARLAELAHAAGALVFVDAVHYAPHGPVDVRRIGCDFLACSAYKFFGPHLGILYGRHDLLEAWPAPKVRPSPAGPPGKWETGTQNFEAIAGLGGTLDYFEWVGTHFGTGFAPGLEKTYQGRALRLKQALAAIQAYERGLSLSLLKALQAVPGLRVYGLADPARFEERVPTFAFRHDVLPPRKVAERLDEEGIYVWDGHYYALEAARRLGLEDKGGMARAGAVHYNTADEIDRFGKALARLGK
jgi:cysteine desulfurase family protein (TIGR01976 family)